MPTLDVRRLGSQRTRETGAVKINPGLAQYAGGFAREAAGVAGVAADVFNAAQNAADSLATRKALAKFQAAYLTKYGELADNIGGYQSLPDDARALGDELTQSALEGLRPDVAESVRQSIGEWMLGREPHIAQDQRRNRVAQAQSDTYEADRAAREAYFAAPDAQTKDELLREIGDIWSHAVAVGAHSPEAAARNRDQSISEVQEVSILDEMSRNPHAVARQLNNAEAFPGLDNERRVRLRAMAEGQARALDAAARAEAARAQAERDRAAAREHDAFLSDLVLQADAGALTEGDVETLWQAGQLEAGERTRLTLQVRQIEDQRARGERDESLGALEQGIDDGSLGRKELETELAARGYTHAQKSALRSKLDKREAAVASERALRLHVADAVTGNAMLDMEDKGQREAWDARYREFIAPKIMADRDKGLAQLWQESANAGALPPAFVRGIEVGALHADPEAAGTVVETYQRMLLNAPQLAGQINASTRTVLNDAALLADGGLSQSEAIARARENLKRPEGERKAARDQLSTKDVRDVSDKALQDFARSNGGDRDAIPPRLQAQYRDALEVAYTTTGNLEAAIATARQQVERTWGETSLPSIGGGLMYYPPEKLYGSPKLGPAILEQFKDETAAYGKDVRIMSDAETARGKGYLVYNMDDGVPRPVLNEAGLPRRWTFDYSSSKAKERNDRHVQKVISDAKREQKKVRELEKDPAAWSTARGAGRALTPADRAVLDRIEKNR